MRRRLAEVLASPQEGVLDRLRLPQHCPTFFGELVRHLW